MLMGAALACDATNGSPVVALDSAGLQARLESSPARAVVINFWSTWCPSCLAEMPDLVKVHDTYRTRDVEVLAVCLDLVTHGKGSADEIEAFAVAREIALPVVALTGDLGTVQETFQLGRGIPVTMIWSGGERRTVHQGPIDEAELSRLIDDLLDG
jgi:thiol-disulfide isomerase/thioredoxin